MPPKQKGINVIVVDKDKKVLVDAFILKGDSKYLYRLIENLRVDNDN